MVSKKKLMLKLLWEQCSNPIATLPPRGWLQDGCDVCSQSLQRSSKGALKEPTGSNRRQQGPTGANRVLYKDLIKVLSQVLNKELQNLQNSTLLTLKKDHQNLQNSTLLVLKKDHQNLQNSNLLTLKKVLVLGSWF